MNALFVHGMGRSSFSWTPTLIRFRFNQINSSAFNYFVAREDFSSIVEKLVDELVKISKNGDYIVIGHSLGGVLLRAAIDILPSDCLPNKLFLLGSPITPSKLADRLKDIYIFDKLTGDCGDLLGSQERMQSIPIPRIPTIAIIGNSGPTGQFSPFGSELNDGVVSVSEVSADWFEEKFFVPVIHTLLPSSKLVSDIILKILLNQKGVDIMGTRELEIFKSGLTVLANDPKMIGNMLESLGCCMPNVETKTMGGPIFWEDLANVQGWRVQQNKVFGNCRILDPENVRRAWGGKTAILGAFSDLMKIAVR